MSESDSSPAYVADQMSLAKALGVHPSTISRLKSDGRIAPGSDGLWCVESVLKQWKESADLRQSAAAETRAQTRLGQGRDAHLASPVPTGLPSMDEDAGHFDHLYGEDHKENFKIALSLEKREKAAQARIDRMKAEDLLVEKADVQRGAYTEARIVRDAFMNLPTKIAPLLAPVTDAFELERMLRNAIRQVLTDCVRAPIEEAGR